MKTTILFIMTDTIRSENKQLQETLIDWESKGKAHHLFLFLIVIINMLAIFRLYNGNIIPLISHIFSNKTDIGIENVIVTIRIILFINLFILLSLNLLLLLNFLKDSFYWLILFFGNMSLYIGSLLVDIQSRWFILFFPIILFYYYFSFPKKIGYIWGTIHLLYGITYFLLYKSYLDTDRWSELIFSIIIISQSILLFIFAKEKFESLKSQIQLLDQLPFGYILIDSDFNCIHSNQYLKKILPEISLRESNKCYNLIHGYNSEEDCNNGNFPCPFKQLSLSESREANLPRYTRKYTEDSLHYVVPFIVYGKKKKYIAKILIDTAQLDTIHKSLPKGVLHVYRNSLKPIIDDIKKINDNTDNRSCIATKLESLNERMNENMDLLENFLNEQIPSSINVHYLLTEVERNVRKILNDCEVSVAIESELQDIFVWYSEAFFKYDMQDLFSNIGLHSPNSQIEIYSEKEKNDKDYSCFTVKQIPIKVITEAQFEKIQMVLQNNDAILGKEHTGIRHICFRMNFFGGYLKLERNYIEKKEISVLYWKFYYRRIKL